MQPIDRRKGERFPLVLAVDYPGAAGAVRDYTENLCEGGLFIRTEREFTEGDRVALVLSFPGLMEPQELTVQVVRRRAEGPQGPAGVAVVVPEDAASSRERLATLAQLAAATPPLVEPYRVLLVEDDSLVAAMYTSALKRHASREGLGGLTIELAVDGREALARLREAPPVDIVVTDVYMPVMDGFALLERIRADPALSPMPVVVITSGNAEERARALRLGADLFVQKPVKYQDVVATIRALLSSRGRSPVPSVPG